VNVNVLWFKNKKVVFLSKKQDIYFKV